MKARKTKTKANPKITVPFLKSIIADLRKVRKRHPAAFPVLAHLADKYRDGDALTTALGAIAINDVLGLGVDPRDIFVEEKAVKEFREAFQKELKEAS